MNLTTSPEERPEPPKGYRLMSREELKHPLPPDALYNIPSIDGGWRESGHCGRVTVYADRAFYATRTPAPEQGAGEQFQKGGDESCAHQSEPPISASSAPTNVQSVSQGQDAETEYDRLKTQKDTIQEREREKLRNEGRSGVIMIRCLEHQSVQQYNHSACGSECGACIATPSPSDKAEK